MKLIKVFYYSKKDFEENICCKSLTHLLLFYANLILSHIKRKITKVIHWIMVKKLNMSSRINYISMNIFILRTQYLHYKDII